MSEESATDLVALARRSIEVESIDEAVGCYAPDGVWDASPWGMGVFEGQTAIRGFFEDWRSSERVNRVSSGPCAATGHCV